MDWEMWPETWPRPALRPAELTDRHHRSRSGAAVGNAQSNGYHDQDSTHTETRQPDPIADLGHTDLGHELTGEGEVSPNKSDEKQDCTDNSEDYDQWRHLGPPP